MLGKVAMLVILGPQKTLYLDLVEDMLCLPPASWQELKPMRKLTMLGSYAGAYHLGYCKPRFFHTRET